MHAWSIHCQSSRLRCCQVSRNVQVGPRCPHRGMALSTARVNYSMCLPIKFTPPCRILQRAPHSPAFILLWWTNDRSGRCSSSAATGCCHFACLRSQVTGDWPNKNTHTAMQSKLGSRVKHLNMFAQALRGHRKMRLAVSCKHQACPGPLPPSTSGVPQMAKTSLQKWIQYHLGGKACSEPGTNPFPKLALHL